MGSEVQLRIGHTYSDRIAPILEGVIPTRGLSLDFVLGTADELFFHMLHDHDFDAAEMSLGAHVVRTSRSQDDLVGLPVFPSRMFRHGAVYVREDISTPEDLAGARIGTPEYQMTACIWIRDFLSSDFGVDWRSVEWRTGGLNVPGRKDRISLRTIDELQLVPIAPDETLSELLERGQLDAIIAPEEPSAFKSGAARRLFGDSRASETDWYRRTRVVPIMHLVVVRRSVLDRDPPLGDELTRVFSEAQELAWNRLRRNGNPSASLLWLDEAVEVEEAVVGENPFAYGLKKNRQTLEMFVAACERQELLNRHVSVDELFWPSTDDLAV